MPEFSKMFVPETDVLKIFGVSMGACLTRLSEDLVKINGSTRVTASKKALQEADRNFLRKILAVAFIQVVDCSRYQQVSTNLENEFLKGNDQYPIYVT